jgi:hypothetical protein
LQNWLINAIQHYSNEYILYCFVSYVFCVCVIRRTGWPCDTGGIIQILADYHVNNHNCRVAGMAMTYKHTNTLRENDRKTPDENPFYFINRTTILGRREYKVVQVCTRTHVHTSYAYCHTGHIVSYWLIALPLPLPVHCILYTVPLLCHICH